MASGDDPIAKLIRWLAAVQRLGIASYDAMALATTDGTAVSVRFVLLKGIDQRGLLFFTDVRSRKGRELRANPRVSLAFYWEACGRQVRVDGQAEPVVADEADANWITRPRQSRLAASVSHQSARLRSRKELVARMEQLTKRLHGHTVPRPRYWSGIRVRPMRIEFWQHRAHRLHQRELYVRRGRGWQRCLLQP